MVCLGLYLADMHKMTYTGYQRQCMVKVMREDGGHFEYVKDERLSLKHPLNYVAAYMCFDSGRLFIHPY